MSSLHSTVVLLAFVFSLVCFCYTLFRDGFGVPAKRNVIDRIALAGACLCPITWAIGLILLPAAKLADYFNNKEAATLAEGEISRASNENDPWKLGEECALSGGSLLDNPMPNGLFSWRRWRRGYIAGYRRMNKGAMP